MRLRLLRTTALALLGLLALLGGLPFLPFQGPPCGAKASGLPYTGRSRDPSEFCWRTRIRYTYSGTSTLSRPAIPVVVGASGMVSSGMLSQYGWDILPTNGDFSEELAAVLQDMSLPSARWWVRLEEDLNPGDTGYLYLFTGNREHKRDQGFSFLGQDLVTVPEGTAPEPADGWYLTVRAEYFTAPTTQADLASKYDDATGTGYALRVVNNAGTVVVRGLVDGVSVEAPWDGTYAEWTLTFQSPNIVLLKDGSPVASTSSGPVSTSNTTVDLLIGQGLDGEIWGVEMGQIGGTILGQWEFNALDLTETSADLNTGAFTGIVRGYPSGMDGTYSLNRPYITDLTLNLDPVVPQYVDPLLQVNPPAPDWLQTQGVQDPEGAPNQTEAPGVPFGSAISQFWQDAGIPPTAGWLLFFTGIAFALGVAVLATTASPFLASLSAFAVYLYGTVQGILPFTVPALVALMSLGVLFLERYGRQA